MKRDRDRCRRRRPTAWIFMALLSPLMTAGAARAQGDHYAGESVFRISLGQFEPEGDSSYWIDKEIDFTGSVSGFDDLTLSLDYAWFWTERFAAMISLSGWEGDQTQAYREFVDTSGRDISHLTTVSEGWLELGILFHLFSSRQAVMPYLGAGAAVVFWELTEEGEFIDFDRTPLSVFRDRFFADGESFGYFLLAGVEIPISRSVSLFAEGRWRSADDELGQDFAGFGALDLSGRSFSGGVSIGF